MKKNKNLTLILISLAIADLLGAIDATGVNIALPKITRDLAVPIVVSQWIPNAYTLVLVTTLIFMGKIGDIIGIKRLYLYGLVFFGLTSLGLSFSNDVVTIIILRSLQGIGTAILYTMPMAIIARLWEEREKAFSITASFFAIGMLVGPLIGGVFSDIEIGSYYGWHLIFLLNIPFVLFGLFVANKYIPFIEGDRTGKLDYLSSLMLFGGLVVLVLSLSVINRLFALVGLFILFCLYMYEKRIKHPLVDFTLFRNQTFAAANLVSFFAMVSVMGMSFVLTFYLQDILNRSSFLAGLAFLPVPIATSIFAAISGKIKNWRAGAFLSSGFILGGMLILTQINRDTSYYYGVLPALILIAAGSGILMTVVFAAIIGSAPEDKSGGVSGILNTIQQLGNLIGVALIASIVLNYRLSFFIIVMISILGFLPAFFVRNAGKMKKESVG